MGIIVKSQIESAVNERIFGFPSKTSKNMFNFTRIQQLQHAAYGHSEYFLSVPRQLYG